MKATEMSLKEMAEVVKDRWREKSSGGCRMLSEGEDCDCTLCLVGNLFTAASNSNDKKEEMTLEEKFHRAIWAVSGTDFLVPRVHQGLKNAIHKAYNKGKMGSLMFIDDCTEEFIKGLQK